MYPRNPRTNRCLLQADDFQGFTAQQPWMNQNRINNEVLADTDVLAWGGIWPIGTRRNRSARSTTGVRRNGSDCPPFCHFSKVFKKLMGTSCVFEMARG